MKNIVIYGAGGMGREVACLIDLINCSNKGPIWNLVGFIDDDESIIGTKNEYGKILGNVEFLNTIDYDIAVAISVGNPQKVKTIVGGIKNNHVYYPNLIAPSTIFYDKSSLTIGKGNIICPKSLISCNIKIGDFNLFNYDITIGHDTIIGDFNSFMPAVRISGGVSIGNENFFGCAAVVLQYLKIGNGTKIGANSLIMSKTIDGATYISLPAKKAFI